MKLKYKLGITYLTYDGKLFVKRKILKSLNFSTTLTILIILDSILMVLVENLSVPLPLIIYYHESSFQCGNRNHRNESLSCLSSHFQFNVEKVNSVVSCFHLFFFLLCRSNRTNGRQFLSVHFFLRVAGPMVVLAYCLKIAFWRNSKSHSVSELWDEERHEVVNYQVTYGRTTLEFEKV